MRLSVTSRASMRMSTWWRHIFHFLASRIMIIKFCRPSPYWFSKIHHFSWNGNVHFSVVPNLNRSPNETTDIRWNGGASVSSDTQGQRGGTDIIDLKTESLSYPEVCNAMIIVAIMKVTALRNDGYQWIQLGSLQERESIPVISTERNKKREVPRKTAISEITV